MSKKLEEEPAHFEIWLFAQIKLPFRVIKPNISHVELFHKYKNDNWLLDEEIRRAVLKKYVFLIQ